MRILVLFFIVVVVTSCKKDNFTSTPQISFQSIKPDTWKKGLSPIGAGPVLSLGLTDVEGDLGFIRGKDTAFVYLQNNLTNKLDSSFFPEMPITNKRNMKVSVDILLTDFLVSTGSDKTDIIYFDVYVKDFKKNKSNVIKTPQPVYYIP
jgi:hypothetical protein